ncbi:MAG: hypothetical protein V6S10_03060 [Candidatus Methanoglobus sp.]
MQGEVQVCKMNIAHALTRGMGWGAVSSRLQSWSSSLIQLE